MRTRRDSLHPLLPGALGVTAVFVALAAWLVFSLTGPTEAAAAVADARSCAPGGAMR